MTSLYAMARHILVVDDDPHIRDLLRFALGRAGFTVEEAEDGEAAWEALRRPVPEQPDLVVLDISMPRLDGFALCRRMRAKGVELPILFLSSRGDEIDRVLGLELGGDDYVAKPFSPREVVARVAAVLKRGVPAAPPAPAHPAPLRHGRLRLDADGWEAAVDDRAVATTATEFQLLLLLASHPAKVFTRDGIIDRLHGPGFAITDRTVDSHVRNLRAKFARAGLPDLVETRAGVGYRLGPCR